MNPKKLVKLANHKQEPWKAPLPVFIEKCYLKRFKKERPDDVKAIERLVKEKEKKKAEQKALKKQKALESENSISLTTRKSRMLL